MLGATGLGTASASASARPTTSVTSSRSLPKVQADGMGGNWHSRTWRVRPRTIGFGADYVIMRIRWTSWTGRNAYGRGYRISCAGAAGPCRNGNVTLHLYGVFDHSGPGRNFGNLRYSGRHVRPQHLWINSHGYWWWNGA